MNLLPFSLSLLRRFWPALVAGGLVLAIIVQTFRLQATEGALSAEKAGRAADRSSYERAQAQATVNALADKLKKDAENAKLADAADARADALAVRYRALSVQFANAQRAASGSHLPGTAQATESPDSTSGAAIVPVGSILIPEADALICSTNQGRLEVAHEWALGL